MSVINFSTIWRENLHPKMEVKSGSSHLACPDDFGIVDMCSWKFTVTSLILTLIALGIIAGNGLVIIGISTAKKLNRLNSNLFILSLAVADLLVAVLVLPFSVVYQVLGHWMFGDAICKMWLMIDIAACTCSILQYVDSRMPHQHSSSFIDETKHH